MKRLIYVRGTVQVGRWAGPVEESAAASGCDDVTDDVTDVGGCLSSSSDLIDDFLVESFTAQHSTDAEDTRRYLTHSLHCTQLVMMLSTVVAC